MAKMLEEATGSPWIKVEDYKGLKYAVAKITKVENMAGQTSKSSGKKFECALKVLLQVGDRERQLWLFAKYEIVEGKIVGIPKFSSPVSFLVRVLGKQALINDDGYTIPETTLSKCAGKEVLLLEYVSGEYKDKDGDMRPSWNIYERVKLLPEGSATDKDKKDTLLTQLISEWEASVESGWTKFKPEFLDVYQDKEDEKATEFDPALYGSDEDPFASDSPAGDDDFHI